MDELETASKWEDLREQMHRAIQERDHLQVQNCLQAAPHLKLWLNMENTESALHRAVQENAFFIYGLLLSCNCQFMNEEERQCLSDLDRIQQSELQRQEYFVTKHKNSYIHYLKSKSQCLSNDRDFEETVDRLLQRLDSVALHRNILKVASTSPHLKIRYDFERGSVQYMVGGGGRCDVGIMDKDKEDIFVAVKRESIDCCFTNEDQDAEVAGTLIHELCHFALHLVYKNGGRPYFNYDDDKKSRYESIVSNMEKRVQEQGNDTDPILCLAFPQNKEEELVVRVPHILAARGGAAERILEQQAMQLYEYFREVVIPDMMKYIQTSRPAKDVEEIQKENARLQKASATDTLKVTFKRNSLAQMLLAERPLLILTASDFPLLEILVHDAVKTTGMPYLFLDATQWNDTLFDVLAVNKCDLVVLAFKGSEDCAEDFKRLLEFLGRLSNVVGTKVVLLAQEEAEEHVVKQVKQNPVFGRHFHTENVPEATFDNITQKCIKEVAQRSHIRFQGEEFHVNFKDIVASGHIVELVDTPTFLVLCKSGYIDIGPRLCEPRAALSNCYVQRRLINISFVVPLTQLRLCSENEAFAFCGCSEETVLKFAPMIDQVHHVRTLKEFRRYILLGSVSDYAPLIESPYFHNKIVHLLMYDEADKCLVRKGSSNSRSTRFHALPVEIKEDNIMDMTHKVIIVYGAPGIGKSALASRLCANLKKKKRKLWVLYADMAQKARHVSLESEEQYVQELALLCGVKTKGPEFLWFQQSIYFSHPFEVVILLDAFDEIDEKCQKGIMKILVWVTRTNLKVIVFSRPLFRDALKGSTLISVLELAPLSREEALQCLKNYWMTTMPTPPSEQELDRIACDVFTSCAAEIQRFSPDDFRDWINAKGFIRHSFVQAPLDNPHFIYMIAELQLGYLSQRKPDEQANFGIFDIYRRFVDYKHALYTREKIELDCSKPTTAIQRTIEQLKESFYQELGLLAAGVIFGESRLRERVLTEPDLEDLNPHGDFVKTVARNHKGSGLIEVAQNGTLVFVHRTFAEFFAAHFLFQRIKGPRKVTEDLVAAVHDMYRDRRYSLIAQCLDGFASSSQPLHYAIFNGHVPSLLSQPTAENMHDLDNFGRTPLHMAVRYSNLSILKNLPIEKAVKRKDIFGMMPLMYVESLEDWRSLDDFCAKYDDASINWAEAIPNTFRNIMTEKDLLKSVLYRAVKGEYMSLLSVLLREFCLKRGEQDPHRVAVDTIRDKFKRTIMFHARSSPAFELLLPYCNKRIARTVAQLGEPASKEGFECRTQ